MHSANPGQTITITAAGLPTGAPVGFQVIKAATGLVAVARSSFGVIERPIGSGNYVLTFIAPVEGDLYLIVIDWTDGALAPETTRVEELKVTAAVESDPSGLGAVADYAKVYLGGENFKALAGSIDYGTAFVSRAIEVVKARSMQTPPNTAGESALPILVVDYLGKLAALQLIPALRSFWAQQETSRSVGNDPVEIVTYPNRENMLNELVGDLMRQVRAEQATALSLMDSPRLRSSADGPAIDETDNLRVTDDPRDFPPSATFPYRRDEVMVGRVRA